jgi:naphthalene 1,2-dioxygenase system ferredoxin subunit
MSSAEWTTVGKAADLAPGAMMGAEIKDKQIAVYHIEGAYFATDNECTHAYALLTDGTIDGDVIECPLHGGAFEIKTGKGLGAPIFCDLKTYETRVVDGNIQILI